MGLRGLEVVWVVHWLVRMGLEREAGLVVALGVGAGVALRISLWRMACRVGLGASQHWVGLRVARGRRTWEGPRPHCRGRVLRWVGRRRVGSNRAVHDGAIWLHWPAGIAAHRILGAMAGVRLHVLRVRVWLRAAVGPRRLRQAGPAQGAAVGH